MDYKVILSPVSLENPEEITAWNAQEDPIRAEKFGNELLDRIAILEKFPKAGSHLRFQSKVAETGLPALSHYLPAETSTSSC